MATALLVCVLLAITMIINSVQALTFLETFRSCTNNNDGLSFGTMMLASGSGTCLNLGAVSMDNGCVTGTFTVHNSTSDCSGPGDPQESIQRDVCTTAGFPPSTIVYRCPSYNDAEYIRHVRYRTPDNHDASECNSTLTIVEFSRLNFCYLGDQPGTMGFKFEKMNATAYRGVTYNDADCKSVNRTDEEIADGTCRGTFTVDIVNANVLGGSAMDIGRSTGLAIIVGMLVAWLVV